MNVLRFSLRQAAREWQAGELRTLAMALLIAAATLTAVGAFTQRVQRGLEASATELLGADLVVRSRQMSAQNWAEEAGRRGLRTGDVVEFPSVVFAGDESMLVQVKAVSETYPLRGSMEIADQPFALPYSTADVPAAGETWVDARVINELGSAIGQQLELGELMLKAAKVVALEPDRSSGTFDLAPRVMINLADLASSGLVAEGSRVRYRFLIAGEAAAVREFRQWLEPRLQSGQYFQSLRDSQQQLSSALDRASRFLSLAALTAIILAGVAIVIAVSQFARRHFDTVAILRCLGEKQWSVFAAMALQLLWVALPSLAIGAALGYLGQTLLVWAMGDLLPTDLPHPDLLPGITAMGIGLVVLLGYGLPPLLRLRQVPPIRVLNRLLGEPGSGVVGAYLGAGAFSVALIVWQANDLKLGLAMVVGLLATAAALVGAGALLARVLRRFARGRASWRLGLASAAHGGTAQLQLAGLGLGLLAILLLSVVQRDLLQGWQTSLPPDTPNFFLINIQPEQVDSTAQYFAEQGIVSAGVFPMAVARLAAINGRPPQLTDFDSPRAESRIRGNVNVSWSQALPPANRLLEGRWWSGEGAEISLAESWAQSMNLAVGDRMTFVVGSDEIEAPVSNIREVDWDSMQPNFFILLSPKSVNGVARTYISSLYLPDQKATAITGLIKQHPNISVIDISAILKRIQTIVSRVSQTVQLVFALTLLAGLLVLVAGLQSSLDERRYAAAVMRTLGGSRAQLTRATLVEFMMLGLTAGLVASLAALGIGWVIAERVFQMPYQPSLGLLLAGALSGTALITAIGVYGSRSVLQTPPMLVLRKS
nr:uncharacterized ABC transporter permease YbbP-like [Nerophis lumbriciformis]